MYKVFIVLSDVDTCNVTEKAKETDFCQTLTARQTDRERVWAWARVHERVREREREMQRFLSDFNNKIDR